MRSTRSISRQRLGVEPLADLAQLGVAQGLAPGVDPQHPLDVVGALGHVVADQRVELGDRRRRGLDVGVELGDVLVARPGRTPRRAAAPSTRSGSGSGSSTRRGAWPTSATRVLANPRSMSTWIAPSRISARRWSTVGFFTSCDRSEGGRASPGFGRRAAARPYDRTAMRLPRVSPGTYRGLTLAALVLLVAIVVTGALVRLTDSGLGCSDWPNCSESKFIDVSSWHARIEQLNRLFTGLVGVAVIAAVLGSLLRAPRRRDLTGSRCSLVVGVIGQALVGGLVVYRRPASRRRCSSTSCFDGAARRGARPAPAAPPCPTASIGGSWSGAARSGPDGDRRARRRGARHRHRRHRDRAAQRAGRRRAGAPVGVRDRDASPTSTAPPCSCSCRRAGRDLADLAHPRPSVLSSRSRC